MKTLQIGNISFEYHPETHGTSLGGTLFFIINGKPFTWLPQSELGKLGEFITSCSQIVQDNDSNDAARRLENSLPLVDELFCHCGHEERWHDNEDSHCDKCDCELFNADVDPEWSIFDDGDNISPQAIGLEPVA